MQSWEEKILIKQEGIAEGILEGKLEEKQELMRKLSNKFSIEQIAELAVGDACTGSNPRAIDPATMAKLFTCTYYGTEVDF